MEIAAGKVFRLEFATGGNRQTYNEGSYHAVRFLRGLMDAGGFADFCMASRR